VADAIDCRGLSKEFSPGRGILDLDLRVPEGTVFGFLGPNGAGKTTTLRLLIGFLKPDRGEAEVLGRPLDTDRRELHRDVGYVPGELAFPTGERVQAYLDRCARLQGVDDLEQQRHLVDQLAVPTHLRIRELSKGNRQKVALVQALQHSPRLLVLDEPTDGLDPILRRRVGDLLRDHAAAGGTVFLSSHVVHEIETVCDQVAIVVGARLRSQAQVGDLLRALPLRVRLTVPEKASARVALLVARHGAKLLEDVGGRVRIEVAGDPMELLSDLAAAGAREALFEDKDLEETFLHLYEEQSALPEEQP
jgi:ABC-2 type transport system ATP-binding protein